MAQPGTATVSTETKAESNKCMAVTRDGALKLLSLSDSVTLALEGVIFTYPLTEGVEIAAEIFKPFGLSRIPAQLLELVKLYNAYQEGDSAAMGISAAKIITDAVLQVIIFSVQPLPSKIWEFAFITVAKNILACLEAVKKEDEGDKQTNGQKTLLYRSLLQAHLVLAAIFSPNPGDLFYRNEKNIPLEKYQEILTGLTSGIMYLGSILATWQVCCPTACFPWWNDYSFWGKSKTLPGKWVAFGSEKLLANQTDSSAILPPNERPVLDIQTPASVADPIVIGSKASENTVLTINRPTHISTPGNP